MKRKNRKLGQLKEFAKNYQITSKKTDGINLLKNKDGVELVTENTCIRPDIYLDNDKYCDECPYLENCICKIKRTRKKKRP